MLKMLLALLTDIVLQQFFDLWLTMFCVWRFLYLSLTARPFYLSATWYFALIAYTLVESAEVGFVGLSYVYMVLYMAIALWLRDTVLRPELFFPLVGLVCYAFFQNYAIYGYFLGVSAPLQVTFLKLSITLALAFFALVGWRGSRLFFNSLRNKRKVWTPNRKGAS